MLKRIPHRLGSARHPMALLPSRAPGRVTSEKGIQQEIEAIWRKLEDCERALKRRNVATARRELDDAVRKLKDIENRVVTDGLRPQRCGSEGAMTIRTRSET
jgi:hypothetical protein